VSEDEKVNQYVAFVAINTLGGTPEIVKELIPPRDEWKAE